MTWRLLIGRKFREKNSPLPLPFTLHLKTPTQGASEPAYPPAPQEQELSGVWQFGVHPFILFLELPFFWANLSH